MAAASSPNPTHLYGGQFYPTLPFPELLLKWSQVKSVAKHWHYFIDYSQEEVKANTRLWGRTYLETCTLITLPLLHNNMQANPWQNYAFF